MLADSTLQTSSRARACHGRVHVPLRPSCLVSTLHAVHVVHLYPTLAGLCQAPSCWGGSRPRRRASTVTAALFGPEQQGGNSKESKDAGMQDYIEVKVDSVRATTGNSIVFLRLCGKEDLVLPLHIGEAEASSLLKEVNKQRGSRPLTHDLAKHLMQALGVAVTRVRITELVNSTYYARIHVARNGSPDEVELDARPSDAINLAVRFQAPIYLNKSISERAMAYAAVESMQQQCESHAEIIRSVRDLLTNFEDPTIMLQLEKELAVHEERYEDAHKCQQQIIDVMTHSIPLRLMVSMEAALMDGRYDEAAHARDEYRRLTRAEVLY